MSRNIDSSTRLLGAIGYPMKQSRSPLLMNRLCEQMDQNYAYAMYEFPPERLSDAVAGLKALGARGFNVTMPYKQKIMDFLDEIDEDAKKLGSVNTVKNEDGRLAGYNTDYFGFRQAFVDANITIEGKKVLVLGAGAISGPVYMTMLQGGAERVLWLARREEMAALRAEAMNRIRPGSADSGQLSPSAVNRGIDECDIIVNITPVGMSTNSIKMLDFDPAHFNEKKTVFDVLYSPLKTPLLLEAEKRGARVQNGIRMFLNQAKQAFEIWTDTSVPAALIDEAQDMIAQDVARSLKEA